MDNEPSCFCECGAGCENEGALERHQTTSHGVKSNATERKEIPRSKRKD